MAKVIHYGLIIFIVIGFLFHRQEMMMDAALSAPFAVFDLVKTLILSACLWNGLLNIIQASKIIERLRFFFRPLLKVIYGRDIEDPEIYQFLSSNLLANLLGLGTLATLSGLKAIRKLDEFHHYRFSKSMKMLIVINTAGFSLIPTTMMTLRKNYHSQALLAFYPYSLLIGLIISGVGILIIKVFIDE